MSTILPPDSTLYQAFQQMIAERKMLFFAGLPGAGKSLLLKQLALLAQQAGRVVDLLQWDVTRAAFETAEILQKYPEVKGVTHPAIRKAVGLWARTAVYQWQRQHTADNYFLLGEVPLIGNRLIELAQVHEDAVEAVLSSEQALFVVPVPSKAVREIIEAAREQSIVQPRHDKETKDAPPNVLQMLWQEVAQLGYRFGLKGSGPVRDMAYDPEVYTAVYRHLLQHRHHQILAIDTILRPTSSAYDWHLSGTELAASPTEVAHILTRLEQQYSPERLQQIVADWFEV
jgi:hypothetical protein